MRNDRIFMGNKKKDSVCKHCAKTIPLGAPIAFIPAERTAICSEDWNARYPQDKLNLNEREHDPHEKRVVMILRKPKPGQTLDIIQQILFEGIKSRKEIMLSPDLMEEIANTLLAQAALKRKAKQRMEDIMKTLAPEDADVIRAQINERRQAELQFEQQDEEQRPSQSQSSGVPAL
jgi:TATA-binding protein-associated factor Taf7